MNSAKRFDMVRTVFSVLIALAISFVIIFLVSDQPLEAIKYLLIGPFTNKRSMGNVVESMIPLIFTGTGVCIMFSANQINLAGEGAFHIGGLIASCVAIKLTATFVSPFMALLCAGLVGALFTAIPAIMKITTTASEMVSSLMINYLALYFGNYMLNNVIGDPKASAASYKLADAAELPVLIQGTRVHLGFIIAIAVAVLGYFFLYRTKTGYELRLAGENEEFARYSGISIVKVIMISQLLGGFVAGTAYMMQMPLYIIIVGFIYLVEVISVILQVTYFKKTGGKRLFKMAPIHHHFELCGWSETRVVAVFSIVTAILCLIALMGV